MRGPEGVVRQRGYLGGAFVVEHRPLGEVLEPGILLLPPLGYEGTCAYRPLRVLADALARQGHLVLRLDWPSLGDSASDAMDLDLLEQGRDLVAVAAASIRARGLQRVAGIGVRGGGLIALASEGLDELALWALPPSGKAYLREERAFHQTAAKAFGKVPPDAAPIPEGALEAGGFLFSPHTVASLQAFEVGPAAAARRLRRALLIGRDGLSLPEAALQAFRDSGAEVSLSSAQGLNDLLENAYKSFLTPEALQAFLSWFAAASGPTREVRPSDAPAELRLSGGVIERPWLVDGGAGQLSGILCEPEGGASPGAAWTLFLNAGGIRRCGPNRLWTQAARLLAERGQPSLRFDVRDVGDSDGVSEPHADLEEMYSESAVADAVQAYDWIRARGAGSVEAVGLCSGSFLGIQTAARREIRRALLFNCLAFVWNDDARVNGVTSHIGASLLDGRRWRRLLTGRIPAGAVAGALAKKGWSSLTGLFEGPSPPDALDPVEALLETVRAQGTELQLVSSEGDPSLPYLERHVRPDRRPPVAVLPGVDHTIRPLWAHGRVLDLILGPEA